MLQAPLQYFAGLPIWTQIPLIITGFLQYLQFAPVRYSAQGSSFSFLFSEELSLLLVSEGVFELSSFELSSFELVTFELVGALELVTFELVLEGFFEEVFFELVIVCAILAIRFRKK